MIRLKGWNKNFSQGRKPSVRLLGSIVSLTILLCAVPSYASPAIDRVDTSRLGNVGDPLYRLMITDFVEKAVVAHRQRNKKVLSEFWAVTYIDRSANPNTSSREKWYCGTCILPVESPTFWGTTLKKEYKSGKSFQADVQECNIVLHPIIKLIYGVTLKIELTVGDISDCGYMFMAWDFRNSEKINIPIRTWLPEYIDKEKVIKFNRDDVFSLCDFDL